MNILRASTTKTTDSGGVVYYANYLKFAERARTELLRSEGFGNKSLLDQEGIAFVVRQITADYLKPARLDDLLEIQTSVEALKNASVMMNQSIYLHNELIFTLRVKLVCVDIRSMKPARMTSSLQSAFQSYLNPKES